MLRREVVVRQQRFPVLDQALDRLGKLAVAEMYVQGVSTRKVAAVTEKLSGLEMTTAQVSRAAQAVCA
jgi:transposase-like protein